MVQLEETATAATKILKHMGWNRYKVDLMQFANGTYCLFFQGYVHSDKAWFEFDGTATMLREMNERPTCALRFYMGSTDPRRFNVFWQSIKEYLPASTVPVYDFKTLLGEAHKAMQAQLDKIGKRKGPTEILKINGQIADVLESAMYGRLRHQCGPEQDYLLYAVTPVIQKDEAAATHPDRSKRQLYSAGHIWVVTGPPVYAGEGKGTFSVLWCKA